MWLSGTKRWESGSGHDGLVGLHHGRIGCRHVGCRLVVLAVTYDKRQAAQNFHDRHAQPRPVALCRECDGDGGKAGIGGVLGMCVTCELRHRKANP